MFIVSAEQEDVSFRDMVRQATIAAQIPHQIYGTSDKLTDPVQRCFVYSNYAV